MNLELRDKLIDYIQDAHAMEKAVHDALGSLISSTDDPDMRGILERHRTETEQHEARLKARLDALGERSSLRKTAQTLTAGLLKGAVDQVRGDKPGKNARDAYVTEHLEIAAYELLERLAVRAGDAETAEVARLNRAGDEEMARRITTQWDRVLEQSIQADE
jgi:ferritin-like metal-binding protein YciE